MSWPWLLVALAAVLPLLGVLYQWFGSLADRSRHLPPGRLVDVGGHKLHVKSTGYGQTIVLEAGIAASSLSWSLVEPQVAQFARVISYDRDGLGWSQASGAPAMASRLVDDLFACLREAGVSPPFILVGHSFGGMLALLAACRHPEFVAGLVLADPLAPAEWKDPDPQRLAMLRRGVSLSRRGALLARLGVVRLGLDLLMLGARRLPRWIARVSSGRGVTVPNRIAGEIRKLPPSVWPLVKTHWCNPKSFLAMASHLEALPESCRQVDRALRRLELPAVLISAGNGDPVRLAGHRELLGYLPNAEHIVASESAHWVHLDTPDLVVEAVRKLVDRARKSQSV